MLSKYPKDTWAELHLKITALELLRGKRATWGIERSWVGDYLNNTAENVDVHSYREALKKEGVIGGGGDGVAFSCKTLKFNRHGKTNERALVITNDDRILKLDPKKKFKTMLKANLVGDFKKISISPDGNQVVIIHLDSTAGNSDLVLSLSTTGDKIGELVAILAHRLAKAKSGGPDLAVVVNNTVQFRSGKNSKSLTINATNNSGTFMKTNDGGVAFS